MAFIQASLLKAEERAVPKKIVRLQGPKWKASPRSRKIMRDSLEAMKNWKDEGKPGPEHPLTIRRKALKRELRSVHRQEMATERKTFYNQIMEEDDGENFFRLLKRAKGSASTSASIVHDGKRLINARDQCVGFSAFYEDLAIPKDGTHFDEDYKQKIAFDLQLIRNIAESTEDEVPIVTYSEVHSAVRKLHNKKASDEYHVWSICGTFEECWGYPNTYFSTVIFKNHLGKKNSGTLPGWNHTSNTQTREGPQSMHKLSRNHRVVSNWKSLRACHPGKIESNLPEKQSSPVWFYKRTITINGSAHSVGNSYRRHGE